MEYECSGTYSMCSIIILDFSFFVFITRKGVLSHLPYELCDHHVWTIFCGLLYYHIFDFYVNFIKKIIAVIVVVGLLKMKIKNLSFGNYF